MLVDHARAMGAQIRQYRSDYFPAVNGVAGYSAMGTGLPAANNFDIGIVISWPIFNSFLTSHHADERHCGGERLGLCCGFRTAAYAQQDRIGAE